VLVFPALDACRALDPSLSQTATPADIVGSAAVRAKFAELLRAMAARASGSSRRIERAILLAEPPSIDNHEMTDKGSINQKAVLKNRAAVVDDLFADTSGPQVIRAT